MGLKVWLPLNGNLTQQGCSDIVATSTNTTIETGKIGSCYVFNGTNSYIKLDKSLLSNSTEEFSFTCWVKFNALTSGCLFSCRAVGNSTGITIFTNNSGNILYDIGNERQTKAYTFSTNTWYHVAFTYKKGDAKRIYINGTRVGNTPSTNTMTNVSTSNAFIGASQNTATTVNTNYLNGALNDVRIYDHCLSAAEIKEISQGLVLHYKLDDITNGIQDSSGYGHNGTITGNITLNSNTPRYSTSSSFNGTERITATTPGADIRTLSCWCKTTKNKSTSQHMVADSFSNMCISFYQGTIIGVFGTIRSTGSKSTLGDSYKENDWNHIVVVKTDDAGTRDIYCNGVKLTPASNDYWSSATGFFIGARNTSNGNPFYGQISDVRAYCTALSADDIKQLYELGAKVDNKGNIHSFELIETGPNKITKQGQLKGSNLHEIPDLFAYDPVIYIEPDGTKWAHIFHHNNPTSYKFASTDTFNSFVYIDENRWFNFSPCNYLDKYEFFAEVKKQANDSITKYRWIQTMSPLTATFDSTKSANVTKITTTGYTSCTLGGLYHVSANTWLAMNNGTNNNWYGAVGCWSAWNGGITGWATGSANAITTGLVDIYVRVDNIDFSTINLIAKSIKTDRWQANEFIEL